MAETDADASLVDAEAALSAGFEESASPTASPTETPATQGAQTETPAGSTATDTPAAASTDAAAATPKYVQLTEEEAAALRSRAQMVDEIQASMTKQFGTAFGKMGGFERTLKQLQDQLQNGNGLQPLEISREDLAQLKEQYPDLADAIASDLKTVLGKAGRGVNQEQIQGLVQQSVDALLPTVEASVTRRLEMRQLNKAVPDWEATLKSAEFGTWFAAQPTDYQTRSRASEESDVVIGVIKDFRAAQDAAKKAAADAKAATDKAAAEAKQRREAAQTRSQQLAAAVQPQGAGGHGPGPATAMDEFMSGFATG
ncbi:MAG: hypothetical protein KGI47_11110 [Betaproteobacteria bacterium]|nr:hypothetical protein [Betaproteobacteria bacterium]